MAPKKGTKRAAAAEVTLTPEAKRMKETFRKYGVVEAEYDGVVEALQHPAAELPASVRQMLVAMLPEGICVPVNERHQYQEAHVKMLQETLESIVSRLQSSAGLASEEVQRVEASKGELQAKAQECEEALASAASEAMAKKELLADVTRAVLAAKTALAEKEKLQKEGDASYLSAQQEKTVVEEAVAQEFRLLRDGDTEGEEAKAHYKKLETLAGKIGFEASLMTALPTSMLKKPADRGSFDAMVVAQLQEGLGKRLAQLGEQLSAGAPLAQQRQEATQQAAKELEAAKEKQQEAAEAYQASLEAQKQRQAELEAAKKEVKSVEPRLKATLKAQKEAEDELKHFREYNLACFEKLRDHSAENPKETLLANAQRELAEAAALEAAEAGA
ncbi:unnamed protein product [Effrenium voratum]|uniref:Uncharacterized protein n=1 Tax=Effrenium voratum TaxID=2562239 RepID=A0AA36MM31_9DINO|nr:unnamed protein product [Effrenium voratum]CAJ1461544.1 unnamed protein product [Effrenium voratum]